MRRKEIRGRRKKKKRCVQAIVLEEEEDAFQNKKNFRLRSSTKDAGKGQVFSLLFPPSPSDMLDLALRENKSDFSASVFGQGMITGEEI